ncbi:MAG: ATP-binding protein [Chloroflexota bacterium]
MIQIRPEGVQAPPTPASAAAPTVSAQPTSRVAPPDTLRPWRDVITPHDDVSRGRYDLAEFAADLAQVLSGKAEPEYQDPVEFFNRTFLTEGMRMLLTAAVTRVGGKGGEPVVQLKTAFGGGKTHTMLALYHLVRSPGKLARLAGVQDVLRAANVTTLPAVKVAVLVGTALDTAVAHVDSGGNGIEVRTLWGEMAAQLGGKTAYAMVQEADRHGVSPGGDTLVALFDRFGPCVILIDELVAYARNLFNNEGRLPAGTFESVMTFVQALTEAAKRSKHSMVVASIPESGMEIGTQGGQETLTRIEHTFGRLEAIWKPVGPQEGFEVVRRRLFGPVRDEAAKEAVCLAHSRLYAGDSTDFPGDCRQAAYLDRLRAAYPIHPEVFDRLYNDWGSLERFQRTRGVLRLMAACIHALWLRNDCSVLSQPGSLPLDVPRVRDELLRYLPEGWNSVLDRDVDGERAEPRRIDEGNVRYGQFLAAQRVARAIFLGSAPHIVGQNVRGVDEAHIHLGVAQPGEPLAVFNDALARLTEHLTYLYSGNRRYWYDTQPNLRREAEERASRVDPYEVTQEIVKRLRAEKDGGIFRAVHWITTPAHPTGSAAPLGGDVPDEQRVRLVVLPPDAVHRRSATTSPAREVAARILEHRGNSPRRFRNTLLFLAPDAEAMAGLDREVRRYLAWQSIQRDTATLNLDEFRRNETKAGVEGAERTFTQRLRDTYVWLLAPVQEGANPWTWEEYPLQGDGGLVRRTSQQAESHGLVVGKWGAYVLRHTLDTWLWREDDHLSVRKLWDYLCTYLYLPRLADVDVLLAAIAEGLKSREYFAYADARSSEGHCAGLLFGQATLPANIHLDEHSVLLKPEAARAEEERRQQEELERKRQQQERLGGTSDGTGDGREEHEGRRPDLPPGGGTPPPPRPKLVRRYRAAARLDPLRVGRDVRQISDEILDLLTALPDTAVRVTLEIEADAPGGIPAETVRAVAENGRVLKLEQQNFEES